MAISLACWFVEQRSYVRKGPFGPAFRYTLPIVKKRLPVLLVLLCALNYGSAADVSFNRIKIPTPSGKRVKSVLTFSDTDQAIEVRPLKGKLAPIRIPYAEISKCSYEFTMQTTRNYWLEIHYTHDQIPKTVVLHMDRRNYLRILDAVKAHTGKDTEILGNAAKRR
jgi:hypothetical protein